MGIRPKADGENIILTDTHRDLVDDVTATTDEFGTVLGEGINEIAATAKSANDSAGELAARVKVLEERQRPRPLVFSGSRTTNGWLKFTAPDGVRTTTSAAYPPAGTYLALVETRGAAAVSYFRFAKAGDVTDLRVGELGRTFATVTVTSDHWVQFWVTLAGSDPAAVTVTLLPI